MTILRRRCRTMVVLTLLGWLSVTAAVWAQDDDRIGTVLAVEGIAEIRAEGEAEWERLKFRDAIFLHDTVRTGAESKVKVLLRNNSILTLSAQGEMEFTAFFLKERRSIISLLIGTLKVITTRLLGEEVSLDVHTQNTVVGIRGTKLIIHFIPPDTTDVFVLEGTVTARNLDPAIPEVEGVTAGMRTSVVSGSAPDQPVAFTSGEIQAIEQEVQLIEQVPTEVTPTEELPPSETPRGGGETPRGGGETPSIEAGEQQAAEGVAAPEAQEASEGVSEVELLADTQGETIGDIVTEPQDLLTPDTTPAGEEAIEKSIVNIIVNFPQQ